jgi:hypothetical protein
MVVTGAFMVMMPVGWASAVIGPIAMFLFWVFAYTGLTPKTPSPSPESRRVEASGSLLASSIASVCSAAAVGAFWSVGAASGAAILGGVLWSIVLFFAWVLVAAEYDTWRKANHRAAFEEHMGAWLPASASEKDPLQIRKTSRGVRVGKAAGLMPWTLATFGVFGLVASGTAAWLGVIPGVGLLGGGAFIALGILVAAARKARFSPRLDIADGVLTLRHGRTRSVAIPEVRAWAIDIKPTHDPSYTDDPGEVANGTHEVTVRFTTVDGRGDELIYVEEAEDLAGARQKRAMLDALLRKELAHTEPPRVEHSTGAVVFDWGDAWTEEERLEREVATTSAW